MNNTPPDAVKLLAKRILEIGYDDLPMRERHVIERVAKRIAVSRDVSASFEEGRTFGERLADRIAAFGGSWTFIMHLHGRGRAVDRWSTRCCCSAPGASPSTPTPSSC